MAARLSALPQGTSRSSGTASWISTAAGSVMAAVALGDGVVALVAATGAGSGHARDPTCGSLQDFAVSEGGQLHPRRRSSALGFVGMARYVAPCPGCCRCGPACLMRLHLAHASQRRLGRGCPAFAPARFFRFSCTEVESGVAAYGAPARLFLVVLPACCPV